jgi:hypothetical protein
MIQQTKTGDLVNFVYAEFNNADFQEHGLKFMESSGLQSKVCHILSVSVGLPLLSSWFLKYSLPSTLHSILLVDVVIYVGNLRL